MILTDIIANSKHCSECRGRALEYLHEHMTPLEKHLLSTVELAKESSDKIEMLVSKFIEPERLHGLMSEDWRNL